MEDTNVKLTLDLGSRVLQQVTKLNNAHSFSVMWDLGPNVVLACKYLAAALIACKSLEVNRRITEQSYVDNVILTSSF